MPLLAVIILLVVKYRYAFFIAVSNIVSSTITQVLKRTFFNDELRPKKFFEGVHDLYFVPGVENYSYNSFPSGHTTTAFSLYFAFALLVKNKTLKCILFVTALLVSYSRIYLSQHFFADVYVGSLIGVTVTFIVYWMVQKKDAKWLDRSLIKSFKD